MSSIINIKRYVRAYHTKSVPKSPNRNWVIGLTNNPQRRYNEHKNQIQKELRFWKFWCCDSYREALDLEHFFKRKGYNAQLGGTTEDSIYLYLYYLPRNKETKTKKKKQV